MAPAPRPRGIASRQSHGKPGATAKPASAAAVSAVETAVGNYLQSVCQAWGDLDSSGLPNYSSVVYVSRVLAAIIGVSGVVNAANVKLNGAAQDITLTETGTTQQVPAMGTVTLSE